MISKLLYLTSDKIAAPTGGGTVTAHEFRALSSLGDVEVVSDYPHADPFKFDDLLSCQKVFLGISLAHIYAGTFSKTVGVIRETGVKVSYTAAAHDKEASRREHYKLGQDYDRLYPHMVGTMWQNYVRGYLEADILIVPSTHSREVMISYGADPKKIRIIPHGVDIPVEVKPIPEKFTVGYLGAYGPDKGVVYLLQAWNNLNYQDATLLLAGHQSTSDSVTSLIKEYGGGDIRQLGWLDSPSTLYNNISLYVQPSVTEGWGCEVTEAMAHSRPVLCSRGAGASDAVPEAWKFPPCDVDALSHKIDVARKVIRLSADESWLRMWQDAARGYSWDRVEEKYRQVWGELL